MTMEPTKGDLLDGMEPLTCILFGFDDGAAFLALIAGLFRACCLDFLEVIPPRAIHCEAFRAMPTLQLVGGDGQVAVPAAQPAFLPRQEDQVLMSA